MLKLFEFQTVMLDYEKNSVSELIVLSKSESYVRVIVSEDDIVVLIVPNDERHEVLRDVSLRLGFKLTDNAVSCQDLYRFELQRQHSYVVEEKETDARLLPFLFARLVDGTFEAAVSASNHHVIRDWVVMIAFHDLVTYDSTWMVDPELGNMVLVPSVDLTKEEHTFPTYEEARDFVKEWWKTN